MEVLLAVALLLAGAAARAQDFPLRAGLARIEITPGLEGLPHPSGNMYGYANRRCGTATGVHDPLFAKVLVLAAGDTRMAIVTLDLGSFVSPNVTRRVSESLRIPLVLLAASHTHSAPSFLPPSPPSPYLEAVEGKIVDAIRRASESMFPARLALGRGSLQLGYNRLLMRDDGRARALFDNLERVPHGPVDPEYAVLRVDGEDGAAKAVLVHYATHSVVLGPSNCKYSADYPGVLQAKIEAEMAGVQAMFVQGGAGDINPLFMARSGKEDIDFAVVAKLGVTLAEAAIRTARAAQPLAANRHPIEFKTETLTFPDRWNATAEPPVEAGIATALINREIAIATLPGEPMHKLQTMWKREAEAPVPLFYGYTYVGSGGWAGYIPDLRTAAHGGYGADVSTRIAVGAGETLMNRHLANLYGLLGKWRAQPGRP